jgi:hypothetical protein
MSDIPGRGDEGGGAPNLNFLQGQEQPAGPNPQDALKGKLDLFRSADELIQNIAQQSNAGSKYAQGIKDILKKWMMDEVAGTKEGTPQENPRILGT